MKRAALVGRALSALLLLAGAAAVRAQPDDERLGRALLERYHCGSCHAIPGVAASRGTLAASLHAYGRRSYIAGRVANEPATLARWIVDPTSIVPGTLMPNLGVSIDDARVMARYLGRLE